MHRKGPTDVWVRAKRLIYSPGFVVLVAFALRFAIFYHVTELAQAQAVRDIPRGAEMGNVAAAIAEGRGFSSPLRWSNTGPTAWFTPIYPYLLAAIFKLFGVYTYKSDLISHSLDIAFSALTCWPIYLLGAKSFGKATGYLSAWAWALLPNAVLIPIHWTWDTPLASLWMALSVLATLHLRGSNRLGAWMGYGALWAVGAMINPSLISVLPFLGLWAIWPLLPQFRRAASLAGIASLVFLAGLSPWTIRNYLAFHKLIPLRSNFGLELWLGNNPDVPDTWSPSLHPNDNFEEGKKYVAETEIPYMEEKQQEALQFIRTHPLDALHFTFRRFEDNWLSMTDAPFDVWRHAPAVEKLRITLDCLFPLLSLAGVLLAYREGRAETVPFAVVLLVFPIVFYLTHTSPRYRLPMDTLMVVVAAYTIIRTWSTLRGHIRSFASTSRPTPQPLP